MKDYSYLIKKIEDNIEHYGYREYVKKWKRSNNIQMKYKTYKEFINEMKKYVKTFSNHSFLYSKKYRMKNRKGKLKDGRRLPGIYWDKKEKIGRMEFYNFLDGTKKQREKDSNKIIQIINNTYNKWYNNNMKGLIIDLRYHTGGSQWPVLNGFSKNILNNTTLFAWYYGNGDNQWVHFINGNTEIQRTMYKIKNYVNTNIPIALIVGDKTTSAGEIIASAFKGKKGVKVFGKPTYGKLSANTTIKINNDIDINITSTLITSTNGKIYLKERLFPDKITNEPIKDAKKWINHSSL